MQKYFITGGAGFVGCHLVEKLALLGKAVVVYDDLSFGRVENIQQYLDEVKLVKADLNDYNTLERVIGEFMPEIVIHLAAVHFIPYCNEHPRETVHVNIKGTHTLLDVCSKYRPKKILFASSAAVYPPSDNPHRETDEVRPFDVYGGTKICGETLMQLFAQQTSVPTVSCRLFNVYGTKETNDHVIPHIINQLKSGRTKIELGNISPKRDYVYVKDVADALFHIGSDGTGKYNCLNIGTGKEYSVEDLISKIASILGKDLIIDSVDSLKRKIERPHLCSDISKIKKEMDWSPKYDINEGLFALIDFELKNGHNLYHRSSEI
ncbi:MAG: hypothetical protein AMJ43_10355 [Coxiella sp. DG_40]|nr:MAG: hypothetical protein AMJ43_10355 [Coxiella sp. DG_40]